MPDFLLETGTEEIPARFMENTEKQLQEVFTSALKENGLPFSSITVSSTPRRITLRVNGLSDCQEKKEEIVTGPPLRIAYDGNGQPAAPLAGFLKLHGASPKDVFIQKNPKGEYIAIKKELGGKAAKDILAEITPAALASISFPKRMRWGNQTVSFARPLHWIAALLDDQVVDFEFAGVKSGRHSHGHRVHGNEKISLANVSDYAGEMKKNGVTPSRLARREKIIADGNRLAAEMGGKIIWKDDLLDEVCGLVECPVAILGNFDPSYLELPADVLLTSMQHHQKSFGLMDSEGKLLPAFLTVLNLHPTDEAIVRKGWERVLKARLEDARFFWEADLSTPISDWQKKLENVIYIGPLGSMGEKSERLEKISARLAEQLHPDSKIAATRAASIAKADLLSGMVGEFDSLQGIMGGIYAAKAGEQPEVAAAISEQYLPAGPDSPLPASAAGAILSIANNLDALTGYFGLGMIPGGAADPQGARRSALAIIRVLLDRGWKLNLNETIDFIQNFYGERKWKLKPEEARVKLLDFIKTRLRHYYIGSGHDTNLVDAVLAVDDDMTQSEARLKALSAFAKSDKFLEYAQILKRIDNILKKSPHDSAIPWKHELLQEKAEKDLANTIENLTPRVKQLIAEKDYSAVLASLESLRESVTAFFDQVMVNCEEPELKNNRLALLASIKDLYAPVAAFNLLQV